MAIRNAFLCCIVFLIALVALTGCSTYQNLTAYFNTYYNAQKLFDEGVNELSRTQPAGKDTNFFVPQTVKSDGQSKFDKVIEKCSKILQFYPQCKLADDAVVLIGESYVYLGEYESAIRKFKELLENFPSSDRRFEAKLWYAKAEYFSEKEDDAVTLVENLVPEALEAKEYDIALEAIMLEAQVYFNRADYQRSAEQYERAVKIPGPRPRRAISQYQLAQSYERDGQNKKAAEAYLQVKEFKPAFDMLVRSQLHAGMMLVSVGEYEKALNLYGDLRKQMFKPEELAPVDLEIANAYFAMGDTTRAFPLYQRLDTVYRHSDVSAKSYYQQAKFYEKNAKDFKKALDYYSLAQNEFSTSIVSLPAQKKAATITNYYTLEDNIGLYDSLFIVSLTHKIAKDSSGAGSDSTALSGKSGSRFDSSLEQPSDSSLKNQRSHAQLDSLLVVSSSHKTAKGSGAAGSDSIALSGKSASRFDNSLAQLSDSLLKNPRSLAHHLTSETKRPEKQFQQLRHRSRGHDNFDDDEQSEELSDTTSVSSLGSENISASAKLASQLQSNRLRFQRMNLSSDTLRILLTKSKFELGGLFMLELAMPDSALFWMDKVANDSVVSSFTPRALYALAEIHRARNDSAVVDSLYAQILKRYNNSEYAREVKRLKGIVGAESSVDSADTRYADAQRSLQTGKTKDALLTLKTLTQDYPASLVVPKAQYAIGWIYENVLVQNDSAAVWYRQLVKGYPKSVYAGNARPKLAVRDNPDSLSKYVKVKEVQSVAKEGSTDRSRQHVSAKQAREQQGDQEIRRQRGKDESVDEEKNDDEQKDQEDQQDQQDLQDQQDKQDTTANDDNNTPH